MILLLWIWIWVSAMLTGLNPPLHGKVLLLTAHPDDEVMFFSPTLLALDPKDVHVLCMSEGQGEGRVNELKKSLGWIGIEQVHVIDDDRLKDGMEFYWDPKLIADKLRPFVSTLGISTVLTFDQRGVSSHPNHISLFYGAHLLVRSLRSSPSLYSLKSTPTIMKYLGPLPAIPHFFLASKRPTFISVPSNYVKAFHAMRQHESQMLWFRWLYLLFSRYMWINQWNLVSQTSS